MYVLAADCEKTTVCPRMTQVMLMNLIPWIQVMEPGGCFTEKILTVFEYMEKANRTLRTGPAQTGGQI